MASDKHPWKITYSFYMLYNKSRKCINLNYKQHKDKENCRLYYIENRATKVIDNGIYRSRYGF